MATTRNMTIAATAKALIAAPFQQPVGLAGLAFCLIVLVMQGVLGSGIDLYMLALFPVGLACTYLLLRYGEISFALFLVVGGVKANPSLAALDLPDMTLVFAGLVALSCLLDVVVKKERFHLPKSFLLYLPMALMIPISLTYTVSLADGLDKAGRFFVLGGLSILAPFIALNTKSRFHRFFYAMLIIAILETISALVDPQTRERLSSPDGMFVHLGYFTTIGIMVIIFLGLPGSPLARRLPFYAVFPVLFYGLVGSGVRRSVVGALLCGILAICSYPALLIDFVFLAVGAWIILGAMPIPDWAMAYLSTLVDWPFAQLYSERHHLLNLGLQAGMTHPFLGVGIGAFRFFTPNPALYDYPHVLLVEIFCEVGILAAVSILLLQLHTLYSTLRSVISTRPSYRKEMLLALAFLIIGLVDSSVSGDINNVRLMWMAMSLPYVVLKMKD